MKNNTIFHDSNGKLSSKRVLGVIGMILFFGIVSFGSTYSIVNAIEIFETTKDLIIALGFISGSLLGIGVTELLFKKKGE